jgi:hypothetical protein
MHTVTTFVLRLFVDSDAPGLLRGSLQQMPECQAITFTDGQALLWLLERMTCAEQHAPVCIDPDVWNGAADPHDQGSSSSI